MTDDEREEAEERAAILQYHCAMTREQAESWTVGWIVKRRDQRRATVRAECAQIKQYAINFAR